MKKITLFISVMIGILNAQQLNLDECIDKALKTHPDIQRFVLQAKSGKIGVDIARADYLPQISLNAEYNPTKTYALAANGVFNTINNNGWQAGATLNQKIWDFSKTTSNIKAQQLQEDASIFTLEDAKALLAYKVKLQYELMVLQREAIKVRQKDLHAKEELHKQAEALVKLGMKTNADASRFLSSVYIAKDNLAIAQANFAKAKTILSLYINEPINIDAKLQDTLSESSWLEEDEQNILQNSHLLKSLKKNINKSEFSYKALKASHYGSVDAMASYTHQDTLNEYDSTLVGITLNIPLYSGGRTSALVQQAVINKQNAELEYNSKELLLKEEFESLLIDLNRYKQTIQAKKSQLQAANQTKIVSDARYKEGLSTYIEVLDAIALVLDAELGLLQAKHERSATIHRLEYLQGKII
ncbi:TolC family protein [bacterium]|nr:TolC family protein [bacterium]MBU1995281.1 TolC family protein [bacterium]